MRKQPEDAPSVPGGHAAERLREFLRERLPPGTSTDALNPEIVDEETANRDRGAEERRGQDKRQGWQKQR